MKVLMLTLILVVLGAVSASPRPGSPPGRGRGRGRGSPSGPAPPPGPAGPAPAPAPAPAPGPSPAGPGASPFHMAPPAPPRQGNVGGGAPSPPRSPGGPPTSGRLPHGIPQPPSPPGQAPPQGPRDRRRPDPSRPIMPSGNNRGNAPGSAPRPADTPDPEDQPSRDAMPENCRGNGVSVRSPVSCSTYFVCAHGKNIMMHCPSGLQFDNETKVCSWPQVVKCVPPTTTPTRAPVVGIPEFDEDCKDEVVIRTKTLDNGNFMVFQCSPGFGYFPLNVVCNSASNSCTIPIKASPPNSRHPLPISYIKRLMGDES